MMLSVVRRTLTAALLVTVVPAALMAQNGGPGSTGDPDPAELERMFVEYQRVHMQLEGIQQQALADPALASAQEELGEEIQRAMESLDPTMKEWMARANVLEAEAHSVQQAGDDERLEELVAERDALTERFFALQQRVVSEPVIAMKVAGFQNRVQARMLEVDARTAEYIGRLRELEMVLQAAAARSGAAGR